jgi:hypothetical protein
MRQKYIIERNEDKGGYVIKEYAEVDKDMFSLLCSESIDAQSIGEAIQAGPEFVVAKIRTKNMYPPLPFAHKIAEALIELDRAEDQHSIEISFDDKELLVVEEQEADEDPNEESAEIDELLEDDDVSEPEIDPKDDLKNITTSLKVADDDSIATDDE